MRSALVAIALLVLAGPQGALAYRPFDSTGQTLSFDLAVRAIREIRTGATRVGSASRGRSHLRESKPCDHV